MAREIDIEKMNSNMDALAAEVAARSPAPPKIPIGMVTVYDDGGVRWEFSPQPDITAWEIAMITNMAFKLTMNRAVGIPDWRGYLEEHKLTRHFKQV